jgi:hypothetical protein
MVYYNSAPKGPYPKPGYLLKSILIPSSLYAAISQMVAYICRLNFSAHISILPCVLYVQSISPPCVLYVQSISPPCVLYVQYISPPCVLYVQYISPSVRAICPVHINFLDFLVLVSGEYVAVHNVDKCK